MADNKHVDRRQFGRRDAAIHAVAMVGGKPPAHCVVRNFSERGALLEFKEPFVPSFRFRLLIEAKGVDVLCEVRHQGQHGLGVLFVGGTASGLVESRHNIPAPAGSLPQRSAETSKPTPRLSGADLRSAMFGRQLDPPKEAVKSYDPAAGGIIRD